MSDTLESNRLNPSAVRRTRFENWYPTSPLRIDVDFDFTLLSSSNGRGPKWRRRTLPNGPRGTPAGGLTERPAEITRFSAPGMKSSPGATSRNRAREKERSKSSEVHLLG